MHPLAAFALRMVTVFGLLAGACKAEPPQAQTPGSVRIAIEDELLVLKVSFPKADLPFWEKSVGHEVIPNFILVSFYIRKEDAETVYAVFALKSRQSLERNAKNPSHQGDSKELKRPNAVYNTLKIRHSQL